MVVDEDEVKGNAMVDGDEVAFEVEEVGADEEVEQARMGMGMGMWRKRGWRKGEV